VTGIVIGVLALVAVCGLVLVFVCKYRGGAALKNTSGLLNHRLAQHRVVQLTQASRKPKETTCTTSNIERAGIWNHDAWSAAVGSSRGNTPRDVVAARMPGRPGATSVDQSQMRPTVPSLDRPRVLTAELGGEGPRSTKPSLDRPRVLTAELGGEGPRSTKPSLDRPRVLTAELGGEGPRSPAASLDRPRMLTAELGVDIPRLDYAYGDCEQRAATARARRQSDLQAEQEDVLRGPDSGRARGQSAFMTREYI